MIWFYDSYSYTSNQAKHYIMSESPRAIRYYTENGPLPESEWSEEVKQAKELLEKHKFQVLLVGAIDVVGTLNYHIKWVTELLREKKELEEKLMKKHVKTRKTQKTGIDGMTWEEYCESEMIKLDTENEKLKLDLEKQKELVRCLRIKYTGQDGSLVL